MTEEKGISPALVIVGGLGLGLAAAVGIYALARAAPAPPPPPPSPGLANFYGKVTDAATGEALPDVQVALGGIGTVTDATGRYEFIDILPGVGSVAFSKEGYQTAVYADLTVAEGNNELNVELVSLAPADVPWEYSNIDVEVVPANVGDWMGIDYSATITNISAEAATRSVALRWRARPPGGEWGVWMTIKTEQVALAPAESHLFTCPPSTFLMAYNSTVQCFLLDSEGYYSETTEVSLGAPP